MCDATGNTRGRNRFFCRTFCCYAGPRHPVATSQREPTTDDGPKWSSGATRSPATGYRRWAATYDEPRNGLFDADEPVMHEIIDALPPGDALDAACGTGRYAGYLAGRGHRVVGVDSSPDMLEQARSRVPSGAFLLGDLNRLPVADDSPGPRARRGQDSGGRTRNALSARNAALPSAWSTHSWSSCRWMK